VKSKSTVEKSFTMVFEQRSQSGVMPPQSTQLQALTRSLAYFYPQGL